MDEKMDYRTYYYQPQILAAAIYFLRALAEGQALVVLVPISREISKRCSRESGNCFFCENSREQAIVVGCRRTSVHSVPCIQL